VTPQKVTRCTRNCVSAITRSLVALRAARARAQQRERRPQSGGIRCREVGEGQGSTNPLHLPNAWRPERKRRIACQRAAKWNSLGFM
jgi:hypothetical protein